MTDLSSLIERIEAGENTNALDVLVEVALFEPDEEHASCRPNAAGTKVIYRSHTGLEATYLAADWTLPPIRPATLAALKARNPSQ
ncbi:hypothetical protein [Sphingopyxis sp. SCN 67-31]|uniref:hypothetical protein n=1 Tax=Sphingopyxis sp. SCN 67-31 TaxID=1660142 RepID=UPI00086D7D98|nr:hypothetical protein [Sphingopyxis sp. SCN 67-31]ODU26012.1 MAG: hypothetical protein ABS88_18540 [Sphingopyxis sp. SCN 67-31]